MKSVDIAKEVYEKCIVLISNIGTNSFIVINDTRNKRGLNRRECLGDVLCICKEFVSLVWVKIKDYYSIFVPSYCSFTIVNNSLVDFNTLYVEFDPIHQCLDLYIGSLGRVVAFKDFVKVD